MEKENKKPPYTSPEFQVLGDNFIEICKENNLDEKGIKIIDEIFNEWMNLIGRPEEKTLVVLKKIKDYPHRSEVIDSISKISLAFLKNSPTSPLGKFAEKARDN
jgi:hypothetical protein